MFPCHMTLTQEAAAASGASFVGATADQSSGNSSITLNYQGSPADGDITVVVQVGDSAANVSGATIPTGYTELGSNMNTGGLDMRVYYKVYAGSDGSSVTVDYGGAGGAKYNCAGLITLR